MHLLTVGNSKPSATDAHAETKGFSVEPNTARRSRLISDGQCEKGPPGLVYSQRGRISCEPTKLFSCKTIFLQNYAKLPGRLAAAVQVGGGSGQGCTGLCIPGAEEAG